MTDPDRIATARLDGCARRLLREHATPDTCRRELHDIARDPLTLGWAAGAALGANRALGVHDGDRVARLLLDVGGDPEVCEQRAAAVEARLAADGRRPGIGHP